jgi:hypothetical protein
MYMIQAMHTLTVAFGQHAVGDIALCYPRRHVELENVFNPFPDKTNTQRRSNFENLRRVLYYPYRAFSYIQYTDQKIR